MGQKRKVAIVMLTPTIREARVMRQAVSLHRRFDVTVLGYGENPFPADSGITFVALPPDRKSLPAKLRRRSALYAATLGAIFPPADLLRHRLRKSWRVALQWLTANKPDVLVAHEPETAGLAAIAKARTGVRTIIDFHEYSPSESDDRLSFRLIMRPHVLRTIRRWAAKADATTTVSDYFSTLYARDCGVPKPLCICNSPSRLAGERPSKIEDGCIHLIHHGACSRARNLHVAIEALKTTKESVVLHFMFYPVDKFYLAHLQDLAKSVPGRVHFEKAVDYVDILPAIARYHAGLYCIPDNTFNHRFSLANKFFDFLCAGLPVITGPNDTTAALTRENGFGWVTEDFSPASMARVLNTLTPASVAVAAAQADAFALRVNAETQHAPFVELVAQLAEQTAFSA